MPETSIVIKAEDRYSSTLKQLAQVTKAFDKDSEELERTLHKLSGEKTLLAAQTDRARTAMKEAQRQFALTGDEADALKASLAGQEYEDYRRKLEAINKTLKATEKQIGQVEGISRKSGTSMKKGINEVVGALAVSGIGDMAKELASSLSTAFVSSAFGSDTGSIFSSGLSGAASGAAIGTMLLGPGLGTAAGAAIGGGLGAANGLLQIETARDDSFKSYVQEAVEGQLAEMDSVRASGSATAGQREQDQIAFAQRFGSDEAAREYLDQVKAMAVNTNYSYDEITGYSKSLLNTYSAEDTLGVLQQLSDATAGLNLDSGGVSMFINGLARMRTTDKATQEYLNYFSERGLDVYEALSRSTGADKSEIAGMVSKGDISGTDAAQAILDYIQEEFGGLSETLASTYDAMIDNLGDAEANLNAMMGEGYNEARKAGIQAQSDWLESDEMADAYKAIGTWQAELENTKERLEREALGSVMSGAVSGDYADSDQRQRLEELADEYQAALAEYEAGSQEAGATMGRILAEARVIAANEYNASEGAQLALESEKTLIQSVREDTALNSAYWDAGYTLGQEFSKGRAAGMSDGNPITAIFTSGPDYDPDYDPAREFLGYAYGLDRVPYDEYPALLHEGERVLTASEARAQDQGGAAPNISITVSGNTFGAGMDETAVAQALADQIMLQLKAGGGR